MAKLGDPGTLDVVPRSFTISVLFQHSPEGVTGTAMEMDLVAVGNTQPECERNLAELISMQVSFAIQKKCPRLLFKPAEPYLWEIFHRQREAALHRMMSNSPASDEYEVGSMPIDHKLIERARNKRPFRRAYA